MATIVDQTILKEYIGKVVILGVGKDGSRVLTGCLDAVCDSYLTLGKGGVIHEENKTRIRSGGVQTPITYDFIHTLKCGDKTIYKR